MAPNILDWFQVTRVWRVLMIDNSKRFSDRNTNLLMRWCIVFQVSIGFKPKVLKRSRQYLVSVNLRINVLSWCQLKKHSRTHLTHPECTSEHYTTSRFSFLIVYTVWME